MSLKSLDSVLLLLLLWGTSSEALFFNYPKNVLMNFFSSLREKKEMKKPLPIPDIHHYHLHYYPIHVQSIHTSMKSLKAPDKHELETIHTNKLENYGWSQQEYRYMSDPVIHHVPSFLGSWPMLESHIQHPPEITVEDESEGEKPLHVDRYGEEAVGKSAGILVQVPLHQQIIIQQPVKTEKPKETHPLVAFLEKLRNFKNSLFHTSSDKIDEKSDDFTDKLNAFVVFRRPKSRILG
ncbi:uncharacterized protein LOC135161962 isoform X1 [Diachasmimorpha longicaudata]|uniref:uncharacterized protein LOC135161962 isoform X1 n=1 Tax=Diachasmimorpha longicaudata TaxID=58733 RepID=UPI0030B9092C